MDFSLFDLLSWYLVFLFSLVAHEASHALVAWKLGDPTAYLGGQVTLDPTPHIKREPMGMVVLPLVTFLSQGWMIGWASAPYNRAWAMAYPRRAALMAAAGPLSNFLIVVGALVLLKAGLQAGWFVKPFHWDMQRIVVAVSADWTYVAARLLSIAFTLNVVLCFFNLIPLPPLDGSAFLQAVLPQAQAERYAQLIATPVMSWGGLLVAWWVFPKFGHDLLRHAVELLY